MVCNSSLLASCLMPYVFRNNTRTAKLTSIKKTLTVCISEASNTKNHLQHLRRMASTLPLNWGSFFPVLSVVRFLYLIPTRSNPFK